jgi:hypothetical protein
MGLAKPINVSVLIQQGTKQRPSPRALDRIVCSEVVAELPAEASVVSFARHGGRPQCPRLHVRVLIGAEFSDIEWTPIVTGPRQCFLLPFLGCARPFRPFPRFAVLHPAGSLG